MVEGKSISTRIEKTEYRHSRDSSRNITTVNDALYCVKFIVHSSILSHITFFVFEIAIAATAEICTNTSHLHNYYANEQTV
mmetsp:Transcript_27206/g.59904  ORF Transcript_27206/g.59904 Transcript_27206/m.59904 type:complete len:81 (+) Transcript_27206:36-278(+)